MNNEKEQNSNQSKIECELLEMGFTKEQIKLALLVTEDKQSAIQYIMSNTEVQAKINQQDIKTQQNKNQCQEQFQSDQEQSYKMIFLMRMDLKLGLGKMASQIANATLAAYKLMDIKKQKDQFAQVAFYQWMESGTKKIVVKVQTQEQLLNLIQKVKIKNINYYLCRSTATDELNQPQGTIICAAIGPAQENVLDALTGHLKLL